MKKYQEQKEIIIKYFSNLSSDILKIKEIGFMELIKKYIVVVYIAIALILGIVAIVIINGETTLEKALVTFEEGLLAGDSNAIKKYVRVGGEKVQAKELEPVAENYKGNRVEVEKLIKELRTNEESGNFTWIEEEKFLKDDNYINIDRISLKFNIEEHIDTTKLKLNLDGERVLDVSKFQSVVPGNHTIEYVYSTEFGDVKEDIQISVEKNTLQPIDIAVRYITLYTDFQDATVYINNNAIEEKASDIKQFGPIPSEGSIEIFLEQDFPWGTIKSDVSKVADSDYLNIDINMVNDKLMSDVNNKINGFYESVFQGLNEGNKELITNCTEEVSKKIYDYMEKEYFIIKNDYEIGELNINIEKSEFKKIEESYKASVVTKVDYTISKAWIPFTEKEYETYFLLSMDYIEGQWTIDDIQEFNIENLE